MKHPLEKYILIAEHNFITKLEDKFYTTYCQELEQGLYVNIEKENDRIKVMGVDLDGENFSAYTTFSSYFITEYNKLEKETYSSIDYFLLELLDEPKQKVFIKNTIAKLKELQNVITENTIEQKYEPYKAILLDKILSLQKLIVNTHLKEGRNINNNISKIKWLGTNMQLGTLFFDLWRGQIPVNKNNKFFKSMIETKKGELEKFLLANFVDKDGNEFIPKAFDEIVSNSQSKDSKRATTDRIELSFPPSPSPK